MMSRTLIALLPALALLGACGPGGGPAQEVAFSELGQVSDTELLFCCEEGEPLATLVVDRNILGVSHSLEGLPFGLELTGLTIHDVVPSQGVRFVVGERGDFDPELDGYDFGPTQSTVEIEVWTDSCGIDEVSFRVRLIEFQVADPFLGSDFERDARGNIKNSALLPLEFGFEEITLTRDPECGGEAPVEDATLTIELAGAGDGQARASWGVSSSQTCTGSCQIVVPRGTNVGIEAMPLGGSIFSHFEGNDDADGEFASVTLNGDRTVKVFFEVG